jgi:aminoglycoside/choline kinase family phosphotransferase/dTDP-glucose pyrophosphorylase
MKALILAAGFGTRLLPYTRSRPKPLFTIAGIPLLDLTIRQLERSGCRAAAVNTHHHHDQIEAYLQKGRYNIPVSTRFEPEILGTGGAIKNLSDFWDTEPFMVVNGDVVSEIDLAWVYRRHRSHRHPVTLVLRDDPRFNTVAVGRDGLVRGFGGTTAAGDSDELRFLTFTGIQVLDPEVLDYIPPARFFSSIDAYRRIIAEGRGVAALVADAPYWNDLGTPERYRQAALDRMIPMAFGRLRPQHPPNPAAMEALPGDGSERRWYRLCSGELSLILADHGIRRSPETTEVDAFVDIGTHLRSRGIAVPAIHLHDRFSGLVFLEDMGDEHLQDAVRRSADRDRLRALYRPVIRQLIRLSVDGAEGFDPAWTWQSPVYDRELILEKECRYFVEAFLQRFLGMSVSFAGLQKEFAHLADQALAFGINGFMHRDLQSRNIMLHDGEPFLIDFQGGRLGPIQYDLASLLIDPYVKLPETVREDLAQECLRLLSSRRPVESERFRKGLHYCALSRNLQILGAFGYLTREKGKRRFQQYVPAAAAGLCNLLAGGPAGEFPRLEAIAKTVYERVG